MKVVLEQILRRFPSQFSMVFAYGSGVFSQRSQPKTSRNMIDFMFVVDDPLSWHRSNLKLNRKHYSFLKYGGAQLIKTVQEEYGARVYFNTLVPVDDVMIKYGVIKTSHLIEDLLDWRTLYVSGRLHKPVLVLKQPKNKELQQAIVLNMQSAVHTSLLCLPENFSPEELYLKIAELSYRGDFRMYIGEDKNKVANIVKPQLAQFQSLYNDILKTMPLLSWRQDQGTFQQDCSTESMLHHLNLLPRAVQRNLLVAWSKNGRHRDLEEVLPAIAHDRYCGEMVEKAVADIVWWPSLAQSSKGLLTAGLFKSLKYSSKKLLKMFRSMRQLNKV